MMSPPLRLATAGMPSSQSSSIKGSVGSELCRFRQGKGLLARRRQQEPLSRYLVPELGPARTRLGFGSAWDGFKDEQLGSRGIGRIGGHAYKILVVQFNFEGSSVRFRSIATYSSNRKFKWTDSQRYKTKNRCFWKLVDGLGTGSRLPWIQKVLLAFNLQQYATVFSSHIQIILHAIHMFCHTPIPFSTLISLPAATSPQHNAGQRSRGSW